MGSDDKIRIDWDDLKKPEPPPQAPPPSSRPASGPVFQKDDIPRDLPLTMKANRLVIGRKCSLCHTVIIAGQDVRNCERCKLSYHQDCWKNNSGCGTYGCANAPDANPQAKPASFGVERQPAWAAPQAFTPVQKEQPWGSVTTVPSPGMSQINIAIQAPAAAQPPYLKANGFGVSGFVLGLLGIVLFCVPFLGLSLSVLGLIFSCVAISQIRRSEGRQGGKGLAVAGQVLSLIAVGIWLLLFLGIFGGGGILGAWNKYHPAAF